MSHNPHPLRTHAVALRTRSLIVLGALVAGVLAMTALAPVAEATPNINTTSTTTTSVLPSSTTALAGLSVTDQATSQDLEVTVSTDVGTLTISTTTNLTLAFGNSWSGNSSISFSGTVADVDNGLATTTLTTGNDEGSTAHVAITVLPSAPGFVYSPTNGHFYEYVADPGITQPDAVVAAATHTFEGQTGYLASIPNSGVNDLISNRVEGANNVWIGAESVDTPGAPIQRTWEWRDGPLQGDPISYCTNFTDTCDFTDNDGLYSSWQVSEPNNSGATDGNAYSGEWVAVTNYGGDPGLWNDFPPDIGQQAGGYMVEYGDLPVGATSFTDVASASSDVLVAGPPAPGSPTGLSGVGGDRTLSLSFTPPADPGSSAISSYAVSLDNGVTWASLRTSGLTRLQATVLGVRNATTYAVRVRAVNASGAGSASARVDIVVPPWFRDRVSAAARAREIAVPAHPRAYHGPRRRTVATARASDGRSAYPAKYLDGRQLQSGEAASVRSRRLFRADRAVLRPAGRRFLRAAAASLAYVDAITCEGYVDYAVPAPRGRILSRKRARAVCSALRADAGVTTRRIGYGGTRPVVVGGPRARRAANGRIVVVVTRG